MGGVLGQGHFSGAGRLLSVIGADRTALSATSQFGAGFLLELKPFDRNDVLFPDLVIPPELNWSGNALLLRPDESGRGASVNDLQPRDFTNRRVSSFL